MRFSGLMQSERRPASLSSVAHKRLRKQLVYEASLFQIGETIHSGPTHVAQKDLKDEDVATKPNCVFPGDTQETPCVLHESCHPVEIPSTRHYSLRLPAPLCPTAQPQPEPHTPQTQCDVGATVHLKASLPAALVPEAIVPKASDLQATVPLETVTTVVTEATVPEVLANEATVPEVLLNEATIPEVTVNEAAVPQDKVTETAVDEVADSQDKVKEASVLETTSLEGKATNTAIHQITEELLVPQNKVNEGDIPQDKLNETLFPQNKVNETSIPQDKVTEAFVPQIKVEPIDFDADVNEGTLPELIKTEAALPDFTKSNLVIKQEAVISEPQTATPRESESIAAKAGDLASGSTPAHPQASLPVATKVNREMVRLIQEADAKLDSFCQKRSSRASKRLNSGDFEAVVIKSEPLSRAKRCIRTRKSSCRSDKSESETSDSRSVADESLYFDMVDKTAKRGKPKNGEPLLDEATTHISAKYNGDVSSELVNGAHKVKGRRISRANSDESDSSSVSRSNGNIEHNGEKVDFSLLLEISPADRKKFESKKAKIRRKTADWLLISETEQYYNEKEEIMRNKNKLDSDSESDESDDGTENQDSKSDCSDESESTANPPSGRGKGKGKHSRTTDDDDCKPSAKRIKEESCLSKRRGRPVGSRNRKTRYDLTMLNDDEDDDDDENFFGFPVSTNIPQSTQPNSSVSCSIPQTRGKGKGGSKRLAEASSSSGKAGRKRLSDAERFLRDNREYYHFQETPERLRRSTSSTGDKERVIKVEEPEVKEVDKKEESKVKDTTVTKKRCVVEGCRRVTRSKGGILEDPDAEEKDDAKCSGKVEMKDVKNNSKTTERMEAKDRERDKRKISEEHKKKVAEEERRKTSEEEKRKVSEEHKRKDSREVKKNSEENKRKDSEENKRKISEENKRKDSEENKRKDSEENKRKDSEENKRKDSEENKRKDSEENKRKDSEENKRKDSEENKRKDSEENKRKDSERTREKTEENKRKDSEENKRKDSEENKRKDSDENKRKDSEENKRKDSEENKRKDSEENKRKDSEENKRKDSEENKRKDSEENKRKDSEENTRKDSEEVKKISSENEKGKTDEVEKKKASEGDKKSDEESRTEEPEVDNKKTTEGDVKDMCEALVRVKKELQTSSKTSDSDSTDTIVKRGETKEGSWSELHDLYFSFEGVPEQECWYQTYQRLIDGNDVNEYVYEEEPLKFILPYEMPKEYVRDFLCYKKGLLSKKKNDLADLVRKSPRCHASTLALFSDFIPTRKTKGAKVTKSTPVKVDEASSDGTSTPGAESMRMQPPESFETTEDLAILALHIDHVMKSEAGSEESLKCSSRLQAEESGVRKTTKKRGKKKRLFTGSKSDKGSTSIAKESKLFESPLAHEVDPVFIAGLLDEAKDYLAPENILAREASEVIEDACFCVCTDRASCDDFSSADDNTEASSECVSLCDSETIDGSIVSEPKRCRSGKKRRKNLTGWPKTQKKKRPVPSHTSDDNDSAIGCEDLEPKRQRHWKKHDDFGLLEQTTTQKLAALAECDRRASPRKKASVLYMDTWPVRFRTQK
ncbi:uncharacterized protein LOC121869999 isoform X1 [Homarus americanus]|uniref:uncharacterized protein LOC121869999 isoform X1 n=1 Tax=Homarus americanus TaxID=6706 RepID=UPI001C442A4D|nr:uncharacterized protein LOC121869999 isoform X1 [Homarus americanus]